MTPEEMGDQPEPRAVPPEHFPGGPDSTEDEERYGEIPDTPTIPDVDPADNVASEGVPDEVTEPDDKPQTSDDTDEEEPA